MESIADLDDLDLRLLDALQRGARATFAELGELVGLGASSVHDRVKRLERRGFVRGYGARIDPARVGLELIALVSVFTTPDADYEAFHAHMRTFPEVCELHSVAGDESFVLKVATRSTGHLDDLLTRLKGVPGIARTKTTVILTTPFARDGYAVESLLARGTKRALRATG